ncbi:sensor histidine kinase [Phenylobacterium sp.]|jgi:PAS domain S-box-containing protein|uniref:sensor histidine kinase n=1 Tax=Phenylobacterium sp. TaxID=1871053 RepID=UPI002E313401|nr:HWE histidine kinase domain-containing protein [Phenylobacterium sp.]HEX2561695.1 HWE histidine kinase domain-containing protein [Phenylobacterium sp.]
MYDPRLAAQIIDNALDYAICTLDLEGRVTSWSPGAERILGFSAADAVGMDIATIFTPPDAAAGAHRMEMEKALREGRAEDSRWHVRKNGERFWGNGVTMRLEAAEVTGLVKIMRDETATRLAEEQRVLLLHELNHRIKNTLVTVQSIAEQTLRASGLNSAIREDFTQRLIALSKAHDVLVEQNWAGADLHAIVHRALAAHLHTESSAFYIDGPPVRLSPHQAVAMSLVLHELATNAVKHGALSRSEGRVRLTWSFALDSQGGRHLTVLWEESGGPPVAPPTRRGFGSRLIARSFGAESGGRADVEYRPEGVRCVLQVPLSQAGELPMLKLPLPEPN